MIYIQYGEVVFHMEYFQQSNTPKVWIQVPNNMWEGYVRSRKNFHSILVASVCQMARSFMKVGNNLYFVM